MAQVWTHRNGIASLFYSAIQINCFDAYSFPICFTLPPCKKRNYDGSIETDRFNSILDYCNQASFVILHFQEQNSWRQISKNHPRKDRKSPSCIVAPYCPSSRPFTVAVLAANTKPPFVSVSVANAAVAVVRKETRWKPFSRMLSLTYIF